MNIEIDNDYGMFPLWDRSKGLKENIDPADLLLVWLTEEIMSWDDIYQATMDDFIVERKPMRDCMDVTAFNLKGEQLTKQIQDCLPASEVVYRPVPPDLWLEWYPPQN